MSKQYFHAVGRQHFALGFKRWPAHYKTMPEWVREAIAAGYTAQMERWDRAVMRRPCNERENARERANVKA